jgi:regulatory protein
MTVVSLKVGTGSEAVPLVFRIGLADGSLFSFKLPYLPAELRGEDFFSPGRDLSSAEEEACRFAAACYRTERVALRLAARAEQTRRGIARKLELRGFTAPCIHAVVSYLEGRGIIDDERYAASWLRSRLGRSAEGPRKLFVALRQRGISSADAGEALKTVLDFPAESALLNRYLKKNRRPNSKEERFLKRQLKYEGFSPAVIEAAGEEEL